jgi:hypothetical protein
MPRWFLCQLTNGVGLDNGVFATDMVAEAMGWGALAPSLSCSSFWGSIMAASCTTRTLWEVTDGISLPLYLLIFGAAFGKLLTENGFKIPVRKAVLMPLARLILLVGMGQLSYNVLVFAGNASDQLGATLYFAMVGSQGARGLLEALGPDPNPVVWIINWGYTLYAFVLFVASKFAYQFAIVMTPLVLPFYVYWGKEGMKVDPTAWHKDVVVGALTLPIGLGLGWGTMVVLFHIVYRMVIP